MKGMLQVVQIVFAGIGGWIGWFVGGFDGFLYSLITFVVIDYILALMCAIMEKKSSSDIGFKGIFKKVVIFSLIGVAHIIDQNIIGDGSTIRTVVIFYYLSNEGISIIEKASSFGLPVPKKMIAIFEQHKKIGNKNDIKAKGNN